MSYVPYKRLFFGRKATGEVIYTPVRVIALRSTRFITDKSLLTRLALRACLRNRALTEFICDQRRTGFQRFSYLRFTYYTIL